ncbi:MAG: hypothetical protein WC614_10170 [bacterium]
MIIFKIIFLVLISDSLHYKEADKNIVKGMISKSAVKDTTDTTTTDTTNAPRSYTVKSDSSNLMDSTVYLYGNVQFKYKDLIINSNTGIITTEKVIARDSVHITKGDSLKAVNIDCNLSEYFWDRDINIYNGFKAYRGNETLTGDMCRYLDDSMWINKNMVYLNNKEKIRISGNKGFYRADVSKGNVRDSAVFYSFSDSMEITGDTIKFESDTLKEVNKTEVIGNVVIKLDSTNCYSGYGIYFPKKDIAELYNNPYVVSKEDSIMGEKIKILLTNRKIKQLIISGNVRGKRWQL